MTRVHLPSVDSTQAEALRRWKANPGQAVVIRADTQTAGIGRDASPWQSPKGGLWFSMALPMSRPAAHYAELTPALAQAVATTLQVQFGLQTTVKWPNDVLVNGRKVAGLLASVELGAGPPAVIIGVGINANFPASVLGNSLRLPATSLQDELSRPIDADALFNQLLVQIQELVETGASTSAHRAGT